MGGRIITRIMKRPVFAAALAYCAGTLAGAYIGGSAWIMCCAIPAVLLLFGKRREFCAALFIVLGAALITAAKTPPYPGVEGECYLELSVIEADPGGFGWSAKADVLNGTVAGRSAPKLRVSMFSKSEVRPGDILAVRGVLRDTRERRNPGGIDEKLYLSQRGIHKVVDADKDGFRIIGRDETWRGLFRDLRLAAAANIDNAAGRHSAILRAMALGDTSGIDGDTSRLYKDLGIYHLIAISGMQVTLVALGLKRILSYFVRPKVAAVVSLAAIIVYCVFTGSDTSTVRAVIMYAALIAAEMFLRDKDSLSAISLAALAMLIYQPLYLWDLGFQLSFGAILGLLLLTPKLDLLLKPLKDRPYYKYIRPFTRHIPASAAAMLSVSPILAHYYGTIQPVGLISNIIVAPTAFIPAIGAVAASFLGGVPFVGGVIGGASGVVLEAYGLIGGFITDLPFSTVVTGSPPFAATLLFYALLLYAAFVPAGKKLRLYLCALSMTVLISGCQLYGRFDAELRVTMLDVGQGDCSVVELDGVCTVIDGGGKSLVGIGGNTGDKILAPFIRYRGYSSVEHAFITHMDDDHAIGIIELLDQMPVGDVYIPAGTDKESDLYLFLSLAVERSGAVLHEMQAGDSLRIGELNIACLYPSDNSGAGESNDNCLVLRMSYGDADFLMCGDIGAKQEEWLLVKSRAMLGADAYKLSHHGSKYSNGAEFLEAVNPSLCYVSAGIGNQFGHPAPEVRERVSALGLPLFCTADQGAVRMRSDGKTIWVED